MHNPDLSRHIEARISAASGVNFLLQPPAAPLAGRISDGKRHYFLKTAVASWRAMFEAEAEGLRALAATQTLRVAQPLCAGVYAGSSFIVLEYLTLRGSANQRVLGEQLAMLHRQYAPQYGWQLDNSIGATAQCNSMSADWCAFWREHRLGYQLALAASKGYGGELQRLGERLLADFPRLFSGYTPPASMLHGDLWSGNYGGLADGTPVVFDPAFYYGDRETDLAMTTLFGGFSSDFYAAYNNAWQLDAGYGVRRHFYNLYHIINHANLFGGAYHAQAVATLRQLVAEL